MPGGSALDVTESRGPGRGRHGALFLPSEHDELPPGVAFMTMSGHTSPIAAIDFSEPYGTLVSSGADDAVRVWDLSTGEQVGSLSGHKGARVLTRHCGMPSGGERNMRVGLGRQHCARMGSAPRTQGVRRRLAMHPHAHRTQQGRHCALLWRRAGGHWRERQDAAPVGH